LVGGGLADHIDILSRNSWTNVTDTWHDVGDGTKTVGLKITDSWTIHYFASSPPGRFAPLDVSIPKHFAASQDV